MRPIKLSDGSGLSEYKFIGRRRWNYIRSRFFSASNHDWNIFFSSPWCFFFFLGLGDGTRAGRVGMEWKTWLPSYQRRSSSGCSSWSSSCATDRRKLQFYLIEVLNKNLSQWKSRRSSTLEQKCDVGVVGKSNFNHQDQTGKG